MESVLTLSPHNKAKTVAKYYDLFLFSRILEFLIYIYIRASFKYF